MRTFIAIELPPALRAHLAQLQADLRRGGADVKWVREDQLHVTLRFLGEITETQRQAVEGVLRDVAADMAAFEARLSHVGAFPSISSPRVIWVGVGEGGQTMMQLAQAIETALAGVGVPKEERPFEAHMTLGRVRSLRHLAQLIDRLKQPAWTPPTAFTVDHITLFHSALSSAGPTYTVLARIDLKTSGKII
ncbi:MAG: RNA 2',3'-cyclic phosphodiesterase [Candidatus Omnitrophica bacterium]|nr:RNA 2',3'-cyclic phosphodiesterase [Candidatus Omnitrophota bacterium]